MAKLIIDSVAHVIEGTVKCENYEILKGILLSLSRFGLDLYCKIITDKGEMEAYTYTAETSRWKQF